MRQPSEREGVTASAGTPASMLEFLDIQAGQPIASTNKCCGRQKVMEACALKRQCCVVFTNNNETKKILHHSKCPNGGPHAEQHLHTVALHKQHEQPPALRLESSKTHVLDVGAHIT